MGDAAAELGFFEQGAFGGVDPGLAGGGVAGVEVEPEEVEGDAGAEVAHGVAGTGLGAAEGGVVFGVEQVDEVEFAGLEPQGFGVAVGDDEEGDGVEVGEGASGAVAFPVVGVSFEDDLDAALVGAQAEGAEAGDFDGVGGGSPGGGEGVLAVGGGEAAAGDDGDGVEGAESHADGAPVGEADGVVVDLGDGRELAVDLDLVGEGDGGFGVGDDLEGEQDVVGGEGGAVGEAQAAAQAQEVAAFVGQEFPGAGEGRLEFEGDAVDVDEVGREPVGDHGVGDPGGEEPVEGGGVVCDGDDEVAAGRAGEVFQDEVVGRAGRLSRRRAHRQEAERQQGQGGRESQQSRHARSFREIAFGVKKLPVPGEVCWLQHLRASAKRILAVDSFDNSEFDVLPCGPACSSGPNIAGLEPRPIVRLGGVASDPKHEYGTFRAMQIPSGTEGFLGYFSRLQESVRELADFY